MKIAILTLALVACAAASGYVSEVWTREQEIANGVVHNKFSSPLPHTYVKDTPTSLNWGNMNGQNLITKNLNQHIPQYCGSCWAHGAISALGDRIKIARKGQGVDINLAVQFILNCGNAGSCHGGSATAVYQFIHSLGKTTGVPYDTCQPYLACSSEQTTGLCVGQDWSCTAINTCRSCSTFPPQGSCTAIDHYPNATVAEYGEVSGEANMMAEIQARGPIACGIDASQILDYTTGVATGQCGSIDHIVSVVGWGVDGSDKYWIVRNSWGEFYGELGYLRVKKGNDDLCLEDMCSWATPGSWTETNFPCSEDGSNCAPSASHYVDPAHTQGVKTMHLAKNL